MNWRYRLSEIVPVLFRSTHTVNAPGPRRRQRSIWVQWRGRVLWHRVSPA